jgi:hypothetical protein
MGMQYDVQSAFINQSGFITAVNRTRLKGVSARGNANNAGQLDMFATPTAPVAATYGQSGAVITVTSNNHGLVNGQKIGIAYSPGTGGTAMCGNVRVTVTDANTFTIPCINSFTITGTPACRYVPNGAWLMTLSIASTDIFNNYFLIPGEGILADNQIYCSMSNVSAVTIFHG